MIVRRTFLALLGLGPWLASLVRAQTPVARTQVTFVLTNDIYLMDETAMADGRRRGGFARLAAVVKAERARGLTEGRRVIVAHAGDTLSPSLMSSVDRGAHIVALTNIIQPDIFVPGNHEFDFGKSIFLDRIAEAKFPLFAANLRTAQGERLSGFKDRAIVDLDGVRIGLTGAAYEGSHRLSSPGDLTFRPTVETMQSEAAALRRDGADLVVAVMHADRSRTLTLATTGEVDLILTGHTHDLLVAYDGRVATAESSYDAHYVTMIDVAVEVTLRDGKRQSSWRPQFRVVDTATITPDPAVAAVVAAYQRRLGDSMNVPLATTAVELDSRVTTVRAREAAIGNLIADAMRRAARADVAVMNGGGIRGGKVYPPGTVITRRDVLAELPFGNRLVTIEVSGRNLSQALENGLTQLPNVSGRFPQLSGVAINIDPGRPPGGRILSITVGGAPLQPERIYRVATNDFLARGGDNYAAFRDARPIMPVEDSPPLANEVMAYFESLGMLQTGVEGRIAVK
jgi:2',3'-cyclic-nucleotide 2'-phosphodiesterase (5'-nucleotidase family)